MQRNLLLQRHMFTCATIPFFSTTTVRQNKSMLDLTEVREAETTKRFLPLFLSKTVVKAGLYTQKNSISLLCCCCDCVLDFQFYVNKSGNILLNDSHMLI